MSKYFFFLTQIQLGNFFMLWAWENVKKFIDVLPCNWCFTLLFQVGNVLIYDPISLRIILLPVPEYPIVTKENKPEEETDMFVDLSPYKEDGSLEVNQ